MFPAPDEHVPYIIQLHIMSIKPANKAVELLISSSFWLVSEKKTDAVNAYLKKNSKGEVEKEKKKKRRVGQRGRTLTNSRKDWVEFYGRIK